MTRILDAHALIGFFEKEPWYDKVHSAFLDAVEKDTDLLLTSVNYGEVYYIILRECGQQKVEEIEKIMQTLPIEIVDVDVAISREAACFKAKYKLSYADCFAAALTKLKKGELLTGDKEFEKLKEQIRIYWP